MASDDHTGQTRRNVYTDSQRVHYTVVVNCNIIAPLMWRSDRKWCWRHPQRDALIGRGCVDRGGHGQIQIGHHRWSDSPIGYNGYIIVPIRERGRERESERERERARGLTLKENTKGSVCVSVSLCVSCCLCKQAIMRVPVCCQRSSIKDFCNLGSQISCHLPVQE